MVVQGAGIPDKQYADVLQQALEQRDIEHWHELQQREQKHISDMSSRLELLTDMYNATIEQMRTDHALEMDAERVRQRDTLQKAVASARAEQEEERQRERQRAAEMHHQIPALTQEVSHRISPFILSLIFLRLCSCICNFRRNLFDPSAQL